MKVILKQNVKNLGMVGSVVDVKPGYARNFLVPHRLAEIATEGAIKNWQLGAQRRQKRIDAELAEARALAEKLTGIVLPFTKRTRRAFRAGRRCRSGRSGGFGGRGLGFFHFFSHFYISLHVVLERHVIFRHVSGGDVVFHSGGHSFITRSARCSKF